ncbi:hypothetical protein [Bordetella bronchialis]|uniref:Uncharacterized protein n=1 Tax=Bordetella bronchialis TaxID=463025 RepID=A0A193FT31_9BORD|nr:hypothetical protein [Bordetella bronchialis]ANN65186.1 hypothetical protein BAU06_01675 [Bordetella bronchialis]ANN70219.1 hypothetical protein BAU08_01665 [Bordetella bronchialis]
MTNLALNQNLRLTDALERDILETTLNTQPAAHPVHAVKRAARAVAHGVGAFFNFIEEVQDTMTRAQQQSGRIHGSHW